MSILQTLRNWLAPLPPAQINVVEVPSHTINTYHGGLLNPVQMALNARASALAEAENKQLKFLLANAPMMNAPLIYEAPEWFRRVSTAYGYMHPTTMAQYVSPGPSGFVVFPLSPTKWILTPLMPEGTVLLSPTLGVEIDR